MISVNTYQIIGKKIHTNKDNENKKSGYLYLCYPITHSGEGYAFWPNSQVYIPISIYDNYKIGDICRLETAYNRDGKQYVKSVIVVDNAKTDTGTAEDDYVSLEEV